MHEGIDGGTTAHQHGENAAPGITRRTFLVAAGVTAGSAMLPTGVARAASNAASFSGSDPLRAAMHVHASWSEGAASWETQFDQATRNDIDLLCMTDHDFRALALNYMTSLDGITMISSFSGSLRQRAATINNGSVHVLAESNNSARATTTFAVQPKPTEWNRLRTSVAGHQLQHTFGASHITGAATYELVIDLSNHPATQGRPAGQFQLRYRFGNLSPGRHTESGGLVGVVQAPLPNAGTVVTLNPTADIAALWPTMLAIDNGFNDLSFVATSPASGQVADVVVTSLQISRSQSDEQSVIRNQRTIVDTYSSRFPSLTARPLTEVSRATNAVAHVNTFGVPQFLPTRSAGGTNVDSFYEQVVADVHAKGGVASFNHPFGPSGGPQLSQAEQDAKRRQTFQNLRAIDVYGADILEVGYQVRGQCDLQHHLGLWDTFSRNGRFLTGNGVNDDHSGKPWGSLGNGWLTGIWAPTTSDTNIVHALAAGRAFTAHTGKWRGGAIDLLVDNTVPMGAISVSSKTSRSLTISIDAMPAGGKVEVVQGVVDYTGIDPKTQTIATISAGAFSGGLATRSVDTGSPSFVRVQVRNSAGNIVGVSNPIWLLQQPPPGGIPGPRAT